MGNALIKLYCHFHHSQLLGRVWKRKRPSLRAYSQSPMGKHIQFYLGNVLRCERTWKGRLYLSACALSQKKPRQTPQFLFSPNVALLPSSRWLEHQFKINSECKALIVSLAPFPAPRMIWSQMVLLCAFYTISETDCLFCLVFNVTCAEMIRQDSGPHIPILPSLCFMK